MSVEQGTWLPPCHTKDGGVTGYGIMTVTTEFTTMGDARELTDATKSWDAVCNRADCGVQVPVEELDRELDVNVGTAFCAEALAARCVLDRELLSS